MGPLPPPHPAASSNLNVPVQRGWGLVLQKIGDLRQCPLRAVLTPSLRWPLPSSDPSQPCPSPAQDPWKTRGSSLSPSESAHHTTEVTQRIQSPRPHPIHPWRGGLRASAGVPRVHPAPPIPLGLPRKRRLEGWRDGGVKKGA